MRIGGAYAHLRVSGRGADRFVGRLRQGDVLLRDIRLTDGQTLEFGVAADKAEEIAALCAARGFTVERLPPRGTARFLRTLGARCPLLLFSVVMAALLCLSTRFIWRVDITGAGAYAGEVRRALLTAGARAGAAKAAVDIPALGEMLLDRLPRVTWARAWMDGATLRVDITQGVPPPPIESAGQAGDAVAARDGVIESLSVWAGTAAVQAGDTVRAGDVLIYGTERGANDEETVPVRARGRCMARVWVTAAARTPAIAYESLPTGRETARTVICSPVLRVARGDEPDYLTYDTLTTRVPLLGAWLPVWLERQTFVEVALEAAPLEESAARAQAGQLALRRLFALCGGTDEIIDKWLDYSMIDEGTIEARATAQLLVDICVPPNIH